MKLQADPEELKPTIARESINTLDMDLTWDWPCGVAYYGICRAFEATGRAAYLNAWRPSGDEYIEAGLPSWTVNTCAMGHMLLTLYEQTKEQKYLDLILSKIDYLENRALRFGDRCCSIPVSANNDFPEQCWADTLFHGGIFYAARGVMLARNRLVEDCAASISTGISIICRMRRPGSGIMAITYSRRIICPALLGARQRLGCLYDGSRGEDIAGSLSVSTDDAHMESLTRPIGSALKSSQRDDGLWGTVLDYPEAYGEVSASAGIAAAMVMQGNPLHGKYVREALSGILR